MSNTREILGWLSGYDKYDTEPTEVPPRVLALARAEIERLAEENARHDELHAEMWNICIGTLNELPRLVDTTSLVTRARALRDERERLAAELAQARELLSRAHEGIGWMTGSADFETNEANAIRIVACVNALAGIPDPAAALKAAREALDDASEALEGSVTDEFYMATRAKLRAALALLEAKQ